MPSYKYIVDFIANTKRFNGDVNSAGASVTRTMKGIAAAAGLAFSAASAISLGKELVDLSEKGRWVDRAFNRIADQKYLEELSRATLNEVSNLELMQRAIQADNFNIPLKELAKLFKFASIRAKETGENVDYLVQSIITGIGRKSPLILDNLGISAIELRKRLGGVSAEAADIGTVTKVVADIATEQLKKMGTAADDTTLSVQSIGKQWEDFKLRLSQDDDFKKYLQGSLVELDAIAKIAFTESLSGWKKFTTIVFGSTEKWEEVAASIKRTKQETSYIDEDSAQYRNTMAGVGKVIAEQITTYGDLKQQIKDKNDLLEKADVTDRAYIQTLYREIEALEKKKQAFEDLAKPGVIRQDAPALMKTGLGTEQLSVTMGEKELKAYDLANNSLKSMGEFMQGNIEKVEAMNLGWQSYIDKMWQVADAHAYVNGGLTKMEVAGLMFAQNMMQAANSANVTFENLGATIKSVIADSIRAYIAEGVAGAVSTALAKSGIPFPFNIAAGAVAATGATALFNSLIPAFANGGVVSGPTMAMVGEYPGAKSNPEVIAPLSKLQGMMNGGGNVVIEPQVLKIGNDAIYIAFKKHERKLIKTN